MNNIILFLKSELFLMRKRILASAPLRINMTGERCKKLACDIIYGRYVKSHQKILHSTMTITRDIIFMKMYEYAWKNSGS